MIPCSAVLYSVTLESTMIHTVVAKEVPVLETALLPSGRAIALGLSPTLLCVCVFFFSRLSHTSDFKIGIPVATLPGVWHNRVSGGTGWHGVSIL